MSRVMHALDRAMQRVRFDGSLLLDPDFNIFSEFEAEQPAFASYLTYLREETVRSRDGSVNHRWYEAACAEVFTPVEQSNINSTDKTIELIQIYAKVCLYCFLDQAA